MGQMNYVSVLMVAVTIFAVVYWHAAGRHDYVGPRLKTQLIFGVARERKVVINTPDSSRGSSNEVQRGNLGNEK